MMIHMDGTLGWVIGAVVGIVLNLYMITEALRDMHAATTDAERTIVRTDIVQWVAGLIIKSIGLALGLLVISLSSEDGNDFLVIGMNLMMYGMDARDMVIIAFRRHARALLRGSKDDLDPVVLSAEVSRLRALLEQHGISPA